MSARRRAQDTGERGAKQVAGDDSGRGALRVVRRWPARAVVGLVVCAVAFVVNVLTSPTSLAQDAAPSVLTELRTWIATSGGPDPATGRVFTELQAWVVAEGRSGAQGPVASASVGRPSGPLSLPLPPLPAIAAVPARRAAPAPAPARPTATADGRPSGCAAALAYLAAHAAPGFVASCPHADGGYQATTTCVGAPHCLPGTAFIWIADPCPAAYMNEASNSWVLAGVNSAPIDPYGYCGQAGNPYR